MTDPTDGNSAPAISRDDTIRTVCSLLNVACKFTVSPKDRQFAMRLKSKRAGPRPLLVGFNSRSLRASVVTVHQRGQTCPGPRMQKGGVVGVQRNENKKVICCTPPTPLLTRQIRGSYRYHRQAMLESATTIII